MYFLYTFLSLLVFVALSPYVAYQAIRYRKYIGSTRQRLGYLPISVNIDRQPSIWIHAVSVGEVLTANALLPELRRQYPDLKLFLSTTTLTGQQVARSRLSTLDAVFYFPIDLPFIVNRTLDIVQPRLFLMIETEIWPNVLRACRRRQVRTVLVNGRISSRSYPRYRLVRRWFRHVLADIDRACVQSEESARRLIDLGARPETVTVTGSLKFDSLDLSPITRRSGPDRVLRFFRIPDDRAVVIAASTLKGEEAAVLTAFRRVKASMPKALLIIAPRHPERFSDVIRLASAEGFSVARRTELQIDTAPRADVVVLDTIGELARLYQVATAVFVGGSLVDAGGHNILEPAVFGKPILFGPHMQNFAEITAAFLTSEAALQVSSARDLERTLHEVLGDPVLRARLGAAARALVEANRGASERTMKVVTNLFPPHRGPSGVVRPFRVVR